jgi:hypothetical protein
MSTARLKAFSIMKGKSEPIGAGTDTPWVKVSYGIELELPENCTIEDLIRYRVQAEQLLDGWLSESGAASLEAAGIPTLDQAYLDGLPWKKRSKEPAKPSEFAWLFGPQSNYGTEQGAEKLAEALQKTRDKKLTIGEMEYSLVKDATFIQRAPVKKEKASSA